MKKVLFLVVGLSLLLPQSASAGALYGTVRIGQVPAAAVMISVACPGFNRPGRPPPQAMTDVVTDARGSFSLRVPTSGRCEMRVRRDSQVGAAFEVFVSNNPLRFDFTIDGTMNRVR
jgi:hypothetical protein